MHFYSRTHQRAQAGSVFPGSAQTPDGRLHIAMPLNAGVDGIARPANSSSAPRETSLGPVPGENLIVMMTPPNDPTEESAPRTEFALLLLFDTAALVAILSELRWRTVFTHEVFATCVGGGVANFLGAIGCWRRMPHLLGLYAAAAACQFVVNMLLLLSLPQLLHAGLLPVAAYSALMLRRALVAQWYVQRQR